MLQHLLRTALDAGWLHFRALNAMQGNVWFEHSDSSGSVVNMFAVLSTLEKASTSRMNLTRDSHADLIGELKQWLHITSNLPEGRWQRDRNFTAARTDGVIEASSISCEGVVNAGSAPFCVGVVSRTSGYLRPITSRCTRRTTCCGSFAQGSPRPCDALRS